jgi:putative membrane-bound dehydrogenase-like protein
MKLLSRLVFFVLCATCAIAAESPPAASGLAPEEAARQFVLHPACRIDLVAAEPQVIDPVAMSFAPDGRLWVVEYSDYPNGPHEGEPGKSRIRVLSDQNGDGLYEDSRIFADQLLFANGLMLWKDGVIVTTDGKVLFLRDSNGDGRADEQQVWFEGFAVENPQLRCNHPTLGLDNRIYVANGLRGGKITAGATNPWGLKPGAEPVSLSGMDFCFDPFTGEHFAISGVGQFGLTFNDLGDRFECDNRHPCKQIVLEDAWLKRVPWLRPKRIFADVSPAEDQSRLYPISRTWTTSNLHANQFTAACGVTIYRGTALPDEFYGISLTCEPTANLVHADVLRPVSVVYDSTPLTPEKEFLATRDEWFRPVNLAHGPDGALYVCDMYRAVIEHPQFMPEELKQRPDLLYGTDKGRIWKIRSRKSPAAWQLPQLTTLSTPELVELLRHANAWQRETAQRLLLERKDKQAAGPLLALLKDPETGWGAAQALHLLNAIDALSAEAIHLGLNHPCARRQAMRLGKEKFANETEVREFPARFLAAHPVDRDPHLLAQMLTCYSWKDLSESSAKPEAATPHSIAVSSIPPDGEHEWYCSFLAIHAEDQLIEVCEELFHVLRQGHGPDGRPIHIGPQAIRFFSELLARRNKPDELDRFWKTVFDKSSNPGNPLWQQAALIGVIETSAAARSTLAQSLDKLPAPEKQVFDACLRNAVATLADVESARRSTAIFPLLSLIPAAESLPVLRKLAGVPELETASSAVQTLELLPANQSVPVLAALLPHGTPQLRRQIIAALATSSVGAASLLDEIEAGHVVPMELDAGLQRSLQQSKIPEVKKRAQVLLRQAPPEDRLKVLSEYASCLSLKSDPLRGRQVFEKNCVICHRVGELGVNVAPDISDSRTKTPDFLLTNILDPNRAIDNNFFSYSVIDIQGRVHTGILATETSTSVTLKQPEGKTVTIPREEIEELKNNRVSLMPVGLERTITPQQMADLISFLKNWRYLDGQTPSAVIRPSSTN